MALNCEFCSKPFRTRYGHNDIMPLGGWCSCHPAWREAAKTFTKQNEVTVIVCTKCKEPWIDSDHVCNTETIKELKMEYKILADAFESFLKAMETVYMETSGETITVAGSIIRSGAFRAAKETIQKAQQVEKGK